MNAHPKYLLRTPFRIGWAGYFALGGLVAWVTGCHQMERIFHQPEAQGRIAPKEQAVLASHASMLHEPPAEDIPATTTRPSDRTAIAQPYTAPTAQLRYLTLIPLGRGLALVPAPRSEGKEFSESVTFSSAGVAGRPGLTAPSATLANASVSRSGLVRGQATGIGFQSGNNILAARANRATGPGGVCAELSRSGFFGGSTATCESRARR